MSSQVDYNPSQAIVPHLERMQDELHHLARCAKNLHGSGAVVFVIEDCSYWNLLKQHIIEERRGHVELTEEIPTNGFVTGWSDWTICLIALNIASALKEDSLANSPEGAIPLIVFYMNDTNPCIYPMHIDLPDPNSAH
jgi:hypothetical protein